MVLYYIKYAFEKYATLNGNQNSLRYITRR